MSLESRPLRIFLAVRRAGSVGRAAEALALSQPAVSKAVRRLEAELQVALFEREARGMVATPFGEALAGHAETVLGELESAADEIAAMKGVATGRVKVGATPSLVAGLLPRALDRLLARRPGLAIEVTEGIEDGLLDRLLKREIDLALLGEMRRVQAFPVIAEELMTDRVATVCRPGHPLTAARPVSLARLRDFPWVLTERSNVMWRRLAEIFQAAGLDPPEPVVRTGSATLMKALSAEGDFLSFLPRPLIHLEEAAGRLTVLPPPAPVWRRRVVALRRDRGALPLPARALIQTLRDLIAGPTTRPFAPD